MHTASQVKLATVTGRSVRHSTLPRTSTSSANTAPASGVPKTAPNPAAIPQSSSVRWWPGPARKRRARESARLPPALREQFETPAGRREFTRSMIDKRLLVLEARRRKLTEDPELRRQVQELEERLRQLKAVNPSFPVVIKGDAKVHYEKVVDVLDLMGRLDITQLGLVTQRLVK